MTWLRLVAPAVVVGAILIGYFAARDALSVERFAGVVVFLLIAAAVAAAAPALARLLSTYAGGSGRD